MCLSPNIFLTFSAKIANPKFANQKIELFINLFFICCNLAELNTNKLSIGCGLYEPHTVFASLLSQANINHNENVNYLCSVIVIHIENTALIIQ